MAKSRNSYNIRREMYKFYYDKEKILKGIIYCTGIKKIQDIDYLNLEEDEDIESVVYISEKPFSGYPIIEDNKLRKATTTECIELGYIKLEEGQILQSDKIINIEKPSWQYKWDFELLKWLPDESTIQDGQYIEEEKIIDVPYDSNLEYLIPTWDKVTHTWKEGATEEQKTEQYKYLINSYKAKILEQGYNYNEHQQKCREKDLALLGNAVAALDDMATFAQTEEKKINWAFNDNDISIMSETDLRKLRIAGCEFINNVYKIEAELKAEEVNLKLTVKEFIDRVNTVSQVKCYFDDIKNL